MELNVSIRKKKSFPLYPWKKRLTVYQNFLFRFREIYFAKLFVEILIRAISIVKRTERNITHVRFDKVTRPNSRLEPPY